MVEQSTAKIFHHFLPPNILYRIIFGLTLTQIRYTETFPKSHTKALTQQHGATLQRHLLPLASCRGTSDELTWSC